MLEFDVEVFDEIDSTNTYLKLKSRDFIKKNLIVIADKQTNGRGRLGKTFVSDKGKGLYLSVLVNDPQQDFIPLSTITAAVCVCEALDEICKKSFAIKWVNDIYFKNKKICGILTENIFNSQNSNVMYLISGIGINLYGEISNDIASIASTVEKETGVVINREFLAALVIKKFECYRNNFNKKNIIEKYKQKCFILNREIIVNDFSKQYSAKALDIDAEGRLVIESPFGIISLNSGEVSISYKNPLKP